jgi:hypothetical protein
MKSRIDRTRVAAVGAVLLTLTLAGSVQAQVEFSADGPTCVVFGGMAQPVSVRVHRPATIDSAEVPSSRTAIAIHFRLFQVSSGLAMPLGPTRPWKVLDILPEQTLVEMISVEFPPVEHATSGLVRWETEDGRALGSTWVWVVPQDLAGELKALAGGPVGVVGLGGGLQSLLEGAGVEAEDLAELPDQPDVRLILVQPCELVITQPELLARRIRSWVEGGRNTIWFKQESMLPGWTGLWAEARRDHGVLVMVEAGMLDRMETAEAQWRLVSLVRWACRATDW